MTISNKIKVKNYLSEDLSLRDSAERLFRQINSLPANKIILDFDKVRKTWLFKNGLERIWQGVEKGFTIAIMCSESEPLDCHRFSMVSFGLEKDGFEVKHILKDKSIKSNAELEKDLLKKFEKKLPQKSLFEPDITVEDQLKAAYRLKNKEIGYSPYSNNQKEENYD